MRLLNCVIFCKFIFQTDHHIEIMCLAIPGKIISIEDQIDSVFQIGKVSFNGVTKMINLSLVPEANVGDHVLVHVGVAVSVIDEEEAKKTMAFLEGTGDLEEMFE